MTDRAKDFGDRAGSAVGSAADQAGNVASQAIDKAREAAGAVGDYARQAKDKAKEWGTAAADTAAEAYETSADAVQVVGKEITGMVREYPLTSVLIGLGLGFVLGRAMRNLA
jgi:ElaB/YqjD/DUF883 family membrane-anchored ribosome-binding protein